MSNRELSEVHRLVPSQLQSHQLLAPSCCRTLDALRALTYDPLMAGHQTYQKLLLQCRDHLVNLDDHLDVHLGPRVLLERLLPRQQIRLDDLRRDEVHQIRLDDLRPDEVHQIHLAARLRRLVHLGEVHQIQLDVRRDLQPVYLVRSAAHLRDEAHQLRCCHLAARLRHQRKMDCFQFAVAAARK